MNSYSIRVCVMRAAPLAMSMTCLLYTSVTLGENGVTGLITYMRTDSLRISQEALTQARSYIGQRYGADYTPEKPRVFKTKKGAQDAHEAIRPSNPSLDPESIKGYLTPDQYRLCLLYTSRCV